MRALAGMATLALTLALPAAASAAESLVFSSYDGARWQIHASGVDGSARAKVFSSGAHDYEPAWSPDGRRLAFSRLIDGQWDIFVRERDGVITRITNTPGNLSELSPAWSPDGSKLAFTRAQPGGSLIYIVNSADGSGQVELMPRYKEVFSGQYLQWAENPTWSPDGKAIAFAAELWGNNVGTWRHHIMRYSLDPLVPEFARIGTIYRAQSDYESAGEPDYSPDGSRVAFSVRNTRVISGVQYTTTRLWSAGADGSTGTQLTFGPNTSGNERHPTWSPNGSKIAFIKAANNNNPGQLWTMDPDGSGQQRVPDGHEWSDNDVDWRPDVPEDPAPQVSLSSPADGSVITDSTPTVAGTAGTTDGTAASVSVEVFEGQTTSGAPLRTLSATRDATTGAFSVDLASLTDGTYTVVAVQQSGSAPGRAVSTFRIDSTGPDLTLTTPADGATTSDSSPSIKGVAGVATGDDAEVTIRVYEAGATSPLATATVYRRNAGDGAFAYLSDILPDGAYRVTAEQRDEVDNTTTKTTNFSVQAVAPSGKLVFSSFDGARWQIHASGVDGSARSKVFSSGAHDYEPAWSPDGRRLAFSRLIDGQWDIFVRERNGVLTRITNTPGNLSELSPAWSPDGSKLAFTRAQPGGSLIYIVNSADGSGEVALVPRYKEVFSGQYLQWAENPAWSPDGKTIAFAAELWGNNVGTWRHHIMRHSLDPLVPEFARTGTIYSAQADYESAGEPDYSPDGSRVVFSVRNSRVISGVQYTTTRLWSAGANGASPGQLTFGSNTSGNDRHPTWSPDGSKIAFIKAANFSNPGQLWTMDPDGSGQQRVPNGHEWSDNDVDWRPDVPEDPAPQVSLSSPADGSVITDSTPTIAGTAGTTDGSADSVTVELFDGQAATGSPLRTTSTTRDAATGAFSVELASLSDGTYTVVAEQQSGSEPGRAVSTFRIDTTGPDLTLTTPTDGATLSDSSPAVKGVAGIATGDSSEITIRVYEAGATSPLKTATTYRYNANNGDFSYLADILPDGSYRVTAEQSDDVDNTTTKTTSFSIQAVAPTGKLVFTSHDGAAWQIHASDVDGGGRAKVFSSEAHDYEPAWSPDGRRLAFSRLIDGQWDIFVRERDGALTRITNTPGSLSELSPAWSPDGTRLAFTRAQPGGSLIYIVNAADGSGEVELVPRYKQVYSGQYLQWASHPTWSPDGLTIAFAGELWGNNVGTWRHHILRHSLDPLVPEFARTGSIYMAQADYESASEPDYSPDGSRVVFSVRRSQVISDVQYTTTRLWSAGATGASPTQLTFGPSTSGNERHPSWSPDGSKVAFIRAANNNNPGQLWTMDPDGSGQQRVPDGHDWADNDVDWAPVPADDTKPTITLDTPADGARVARGAEVLADFACADEDGGSGLASCTGTVDDGSAIDTATLGSKTFTVEATDEAGNSRSTSVTYTVVDETKPTITITTPADGAQIARGANVTPDFACADEDGGSGIESCDGGTVDTSTPGEKTFEVTATDKAGNTRTATSTYTVVNSAPVVRLTAAPAEVDEGATATYAYEATDANGDALEITESCGDATRINTPEADSFACRFGDGPGSARVSVTADDGNADSADAATVAIRNVAPAADAGGPYSGPWGEAVDFDGSGSDDAGGDGLTYEWDFDYDGSFDPAATGATPSHTYAAPGRRTVALRVTDDDGLASALATATVEVGARKTKLTYTGAATAQYSDAAALSATLTDADSDAPLPGRTVTFTLGTQSADAVTDGDGVARTSLVLTQGAGSPGVTAAAAAGGGYSGASTDSPFAIGREDAAVAYSGSTIAQAGTPLALRSTAFDSAAAGFPLGGSDTTLGDIARTWIAFDALSGSDCSTLASTRTGSVEDGAPAGDGIGTASATLTSSTETVLCISPRLVGSSAGAASPFYAAPSALPIPVAFYENTGQFVTGGGWVDDPSGGKGHFAFNGRPGKKSPSGQVVYNWLGDREGQPAMYRIKSNALSGLRFSGRTYPVTATMEGKANILVTRLSDGAVLYSDGAATMTATATDTNKSTTPDSFSLSVFGKSGVHYKSVPTVPLRGGQVVVHP